MSKRREKRYWRGLEERNSPGKAVPEFEEPIRGERLTFDRRRFLTAAGFAFAMAGCGRSGAGRKALTQALTLEGASPGKLLQYASTCQACPAACGLLVRSRDGRPIKLEGNPAHALSQGGLCAVGQASILGLYDRLRLSQPLKSGARSSWSEVDGGILAQLGEIRTKGGAVRVLSRTVTSPTVRHQIGKFLETFSDGRLVTYDPISHSAILDAHQRTHALRRLPRYRFDRAEVVVSLDADFLGTWISPVEFTRAYSQGRSLEGTPPRFSWHAQIESRLSVTGAKADLRWVVAPWEQGAVLAALAERIAERAGMAWKGGGAGKPPGPGSRIDELADRLWKARGASLVVSGAQDVDHQSVVNFLNQALGNYGKTLDLERPSQQCLGSDADLAGLIREMEEGRVSALFVLEGNPAYELPVDWAALTKRVSLTVSCSERMDETAALSGYITPRPHYLASWADAEPAAGCFSLAQPTFPVLGSARPIVESLSIWSGAPEKALAQIQQYWKREVHPRGGAATPFPEFWNRAVHDGFVELPGVPEKIGPFDLSQVRPPSPGTAPEADRFALVLYPKVGLFDGSSAWNPWLQEMPDPITKVAWDNYVCLSPAAAKKLGLENGDVVRIEEGDLRMELPVLIQPGQQDQTAAVALGYGSRLSERFGSVGPKWIEAKPTLGEHGQVGRNAAPWLSLRNGTISSVRTSVRIAKQGRKQLLALSQLYHSISVPEGLAPKGEERRDMIGETSLGAFVAGHGRTASHGKPEKDLWPEDHKLKGPRWGMVIDLGACTGCSACVVACQVENNIPVVGKDEVRRQRDLQWIRVDRYYADNPDGSVDVAFQPMMCHHCGNAPCETVCPVLATVRSSEGLNQQVYNRCVGTRYCANNCPYKVRRFNWFEYPREDALQNLVLNPDVTVRSRGVMEKCSLCVQRIQEARRDAKRRGVPLADGEAKTACQQSCPAQAIHFGDLNELQGVAAKRSAEGRSYQVLAELNVKPSIYYQEIVRNRPEKEGGSHE